jgi:CheY-like chemotaxis protein/anti-sigma regulatory factor (Ser/Thr protein kinase)
MPAEGFNVNGDEQRLAQVFANILTNAAKYSDPGSVIEVTAQGTDDTVEVSVRDQGIGISAEQLANVFDLFVQGGARERAQGGLGLGLAIVRNLVKLHGGKVTAASEGPGRGSIFTVSLPRDRHPSRTLHARPTVSVTSAAVQRGRSILVVDDNDDAADTLAAALQLAGFEARAVYDAAEALRVVDGFRPFAAILDIGLPGMTGYELAEQLRARGSTAATRLVALSGYTQELALRRAGKHSRDVFDAYVVKPAGVSEILQILNQFATLTAVPTA